MADNKDDHTVAWSNAAMAGFPETFYLKLKHLVLIGFPK